MEKWICDVCGYTHKGNEAPERCPECGAQKSQFHTKSKGSGGYLFSIVMLIILGAIFISLFA